MFDGETQQLLPSHAVPARILSAERYWEALSEGEDGQIHFPSVTQLSNILANDGVVKWQVNNVISFFLDYISQFTIDANEEEITQDYLVQLKADANRASSPNDAAERGTRFHSAMELMLVEKDYRSVLQPAEVGPCDIIVESISSEMYKRHGKSWRTGMIEQGFVNREQGVAGRTDYLFDSSVYDWKFSDKTLFGKRGGLLKSNWCYPDRALQLAAYADGHGIENPVLTSVFCNVITGEVCFYDWPDVKRWLDSARLLNMFYYKYNLGRLPELGDNTAIISTALDEWQV